MQTLKFTKNDKWWVSDTLQGNSNYALRLELQERCNIVISSNYMPDNGDWAPQYSHQFSGGAWEKNVNNLGPGQAIRVMCNVEPLSGYFLAY